MPDILHVDDQLQLLGIRAWLNNRFQIMDHIRQMHIRLFDGQLPAFDAAHVEDIVDQGEKMPARYRDFPEVVAHLFLIVQVGCRQCRKPYDGVHGRSHIMRHVVQENRLGAVGLLGCGQGF